jgi:hypothetical protein
MGTVTSNKTWQTIQVAKKKNNKKKNKNSRSVNLKKHFWTFDVGKYIFSFF